MYFFSSLYSVGRSPVIREKWLEKLSERSYPTAFAISPTLRSVAVLYLHELAANYAIYFGGYAAGAYGRTKFAKHIRKLPAGISYEQSSRQACRKAMKR